MKKENDRKRERDERVGADYGDELAGVVALTESTLHGSLSLPFFVCVSVSLVSFVFFFSLHV